MRPVEVSDELTKHFGGPALDRAIADAARSGQVDCCICDSAIAAEQSASAVLAVAPGVTRMSLAHPYCSTSRVIEVEMPEDLILADAAEDITVTAAYGGSIILFFVDFQRSAYAQTPAGDVFDVLQQPFVARGFFPLDAPINDLGGPLRAGFAVRPAFGLGSSVQIVMDGPPLTATVNLEIDKVTPAVSFADVTLSVEPGWWRQSLRSACVMVIVSFGVGAEQLLGAYQEHSPALLHGLMKLVVELPDSEDCPCGSGQSWKRCCKKDHRKALKRYEGLLPVEDWT